MLNQLSLIPILVGLTYAWRLRPATALNGLDQRCEGCVVRYPNGSFHVVKCEIHLRERLLRRYQASNGKLTPGPHSNVHGGRTVINSHHCLTTDNNEAPNTPDSAPCGLKHCSMDCSIIALACA